MPPAQPPQQRLKFRVTLNIMVKLQLSLSILMIILQSITIGVLVSGPIHSVVPVGFCVAPATGIWVGVFGVIAAGLGIGGFKSQYGNKCLIVGHLVMSIISTITDAILITLVSPCLYILPYLGYAFYSYEHPSYQETEQLRSIGRGILANESLLIIAGIVHFITSIVSAAFVCSNLCGRREPPVKTVYPPWTGGNVIGGSTVQVLPGTQMFTEPSAPSVYMPNGIRSPDGNAIVGPCRVQVQSGTQMYVVPNENPQQQHQHVYQKY